MAFQYERLPSALTAAITRSAYGYPARFHKDVELLHVIEGELEVHIDGESYHLVAGDVCVLFPNVLHAIAAQNCTKHLLMISPVLLKAYKRQLSHCKPVCPVIRKADVPPVVPLLLQRCVELSKAGNDTLAAIYATGILGELLAVLPLRDRSSDPELVQDLVEQIMENYAEELTLEELARRLGYSKFHLSRVVSDTFHCNFRTLLNSYRISAAEELLRSTRKTVLDIAYATGFQNQSSFNRVFLKITGMTPNQFRNSKTE